MSYCVHITRIICFNILASYIIVYNHEVSGDYCCDDNGEQDDDVDDDNRRTNDTYRDKGDDNKIYDDNDRNNRIITLTLSL